MSDDLPFLYERIRAHLDAGPEASSELADLEHTLTDGYARALELEAERTRVEREIGELASRIEDPLHLDDLRALSERRTQTDEELERLRALLELLRRQVAEQRAAPV
ncbi:MAG TPA: hypothetical protein VH306_03390 [Gaiellaceae bacterium]